MRKIREQIRYFDITLSIRHPASEASTVIDWHRWPQYLALLNLHHLISWGGGCERMMIMFLTAHHLAELSGRVGAAVATFTHAMLTNVCA